MTNPKISVVVAAHNAESFIAETITSLLEQDMKDWEAVIVDDGSTDGTKDVISGFTDSRIILVEQENKGRCEARNNGLGRASAEAVVFLDHDDRLCSDALGRFLKALNMSEDIVMAYGEARIFDEKSGEYGYVSLRKRPHGNALESFLIYNPVLTVGSAVFRTSTARKAGGFSPSFSRGEDWEFYTRVVREGKIMYMGRKPVIIYRLHPQSTARVLGIRYELFEGAIRSVFEHPDNKKRFSPGRLRHLRKRREAGVYACLGTEHLKCRRWSQAGRKYARALLLDPGRIREWILFFCALMRFLPPQVRRRLK